MTGARTSLRLSPKAGFELFVKETVLTMKVLGKYCKTKAVWRSPPSTATTESLDPQEVGEDGSGGRSRAAEPGQSW